MRIGEIFESDGEFGPLLAYGFAETTTDRQRENGTRMFTYDATIPGKRPMKFYIGFYGQDPNTGLWTVVRCNNLRSDMLIDVKRHVTTDDGMFRAMRRIIGYIDLYRSNGYYSLDHPSNMRFRDEQ